MNASLNWVKIGEGDDFVEYWYKGFEAIMPDIADHICFASSERFEIEWPKVMKGLSAFGTFIKGRKTIVDPHKVSDLLEEFPGVSIGRNEWGGDAPGRNGSFLEVTVCAQDLASVHQTMTELLSQLRIYWEKAGHVSVVEEQGRIAEQKKAEDQTRLAKQWQMALNEIVDPIRKFIKKPSTLFFEHGDFLVRADGSVFAIIDNSYYTKSDEKRELCREAVKKLARLRALVIEVQEYYPPNMPRFSFWAGEGRRRHAGWKQNQSLLSGASEEFSNAALDCREAYIRWLAQRQTG